MNTQMLERYLQPVKIETGYNECGENTNYIVNNNGSRLSEVSDRYTLVQNKDLIQPLVDTFGIDSLKSVRSYNSNRSFLFEFMTGRVLDLGGGDILKEKILVRNSYDKTKSFSFMCGAFRMVCSNGLYVGVGSVLAYKKIHVGEIPVNNIVNDAISRYSKNDFSFWRRLKEIPLSVENEIEVLNNWKPYEVKDESKTWKGNALLNRWVKQYAERKIKANESIDNQRNAWGLFNQMNQAIDRNVPKGQIDKKIAGNERMEVYLKSTFLN